MKTHRLMVIPARLVPVWQRRVRDWEEQHQRMLTHTGFKQLRARFEQDYQL